MAASTTLEILLKARDMTSGVLSGVRGKLQSFGSAARATGLQLTAGLTLPLVAVGTAAAKMAGDFESQMAILGVAARSAGTPIDELRQAAIKAGADTALLGITASESADAITGFYKAGLKTGEIFGDLSGYLAGTTEVTGAFRAAVDLAAASNLGLGQASDAVAIAMATFGLGAEQATRIVNSFVGAADASVAEVAGLTQALVNVGPTAAAFGWSLQDVNTALAVLSERGIRGAEAGTNLQSMMKMMMRSTPKVTEAWDNLGVSMFDVEGSFRSLPDILADLEIAMVSMTEKERQSYIQTLASGYGQKAMNTLLAEGAVGWGEMTDAISVAATAQEVAKARMDTFSGSVEKLKGTLETLLINVGQPLIDNFLRPAAERLDELIGRVLEADPKFINWGIAIAGVLAVAGPLLIALGFLVTAISALVSPIGLVVAAVVALGVAWATNFGGIRDKTAEVWTAVQGYIQSAIDFIKPYVEDMISTVTGWFKENWPRIQAIVEEVWSVIQTVTETVTSAVSSFIQEEFGVVVAWVEENWPLIKDTVTTVLDAILSAVETVLGKIRAFWETHGETIMTVVTNAWNAIKLIIDTTIKTILAIIKAIMLAIQGDWKGAWAVIKEAALRIWEAIKGIVKLGIENVKLVLSVILPMIKAKWAEIWGAIKTKAKTIFEAIRSMAQTKFLAIKNKITTPIAAAKGILLGHFNAMKTTAQNKFEGMRSMAQTKFLAIKRVITSPIVAAKGILIAAMDAMKAALVSLGSIHIPLPHFSFSTRQVSIAGISFPVPQIDIEWYKKGLDKVFRKPTIIGVGEAGPERVTVQPLGRGFGRLAPAFAGGGGGEVHIHIHVGAMLGNEYEAQQFAREINRYLKREGLR